MRVVYLNPGGSIGGAEMCLLDVLGAATEARPGLRPLVLLGDDGPLRGRVEAMGIPCDVLPLPSGVARLGDAGASGLGRRLSLATRGLAAASSLVGYGRRLARRLADEAPDLVQTNGMKMHGLAAVAAPRGVPVVWHLHDYLGSRAAMAGLLRLAGRRGGIEAVAVSESVAADATRALRGRVPVRAIHNAVDLDRFHPGPGDGPTLDRASGLPDAPEGTVRVGLVATFADWKGHEVFLRAAATVPADRPVRFYVVGGPIYKTAGSQATLDTLRALALDLGLDGRVGFTGHQSEPSDAIRALDVVVHASTRPEPFGRVIVEGMACGRAVVAMEEGGAAELFRSGEDALGCPPRDPIALGSALLRLVDNLPLRGRLGEAGRASAARRFDCRGLARAWAPIYDRAPRPGPATALASAAPLPATAPRTSS